MAPPAPWPTPPSARASQDSTGPPRASNTDQQHHTAKPLESAVTAGSAAPGAAAAAAAAANGSGDGAVLHRAPLPSPSQQQQQHRDSHSGQAASQPCIDSPDQPPARSSAGEHSSGALTFHPPTLPAHQVAALPPSHPQPHPQSPSSAALQQHQEQLQLQLRMQQQQPDYHPHPHPHPHHQWTMRSGINPVAPSTGALSDSINSVVHVEMAPGSPTRSFSAAITGRDTQPLAHFAPASRPNSLPVSPTNSITVASGPPKAGTGGGGGGGGAGPCAAVTTGMGAHVSGSGSGGAGGAGGKPPKVPRLPSPAAAAGAGALAGAAATADTVPAPAGTDRGASSGGGADAASQEGSAHGSVDRPSHGRTSDPQQNPGSSQRSGGHQHHQRHPHLTHHRHGRGSSRNVDPLRAFLPAHMRQQHLQDVEEGDGSDHGDDGLNGHEHPDSAGEGGLGGSGSKSARYSRGRSSRSAPKETTWQKWKRHHPATLVCGGFLLVAAAIVLVIVPPLCTTLGCPPRSDDGSAVAPEEQLYTLRLLARSADPPAGPPRSVLSLLPADVAARVTASWLLPPLPAGGGGGGGGSGGVEALDCADLWVLRRVREELGGDGVRDQVSFVVPDFPQAVPADLTGPTRAAVLSALLQPGGLIVPAQAAARNAPSELRDLLAAVPALLASASSPSAAESAAAHTSLQRLLQDAGLAAAAQRAGLTRVLAASGAGGSSASIQELLRLLPNATAAPDAAGGGLGLGFGGSISSVTSSSSSSSSSATDAGSAVAALAALLSRPPLDVLTAVEDLARQTQLGGSLLSSLSTSSTDGSAAAAVAAAVAAAGSAAAATAVSSGMGHDALVAAARLVTSADPGDLLLLASAGGGGGGGGSALAASGLMPTVTAGSWRVPAGVDAREWHIRRAGVDEAWALTRDADLPTVVVAVVDGGFDTRHPDLAGALWVNPGEVPGNGIDDDGNGFVDDVNGWDFGGNCTGAWRPAPAPPPPPPAAAAYPPPASAYSSSPPPVINITVPRRYSGIAPATSAYELRSLASCTGDGDVSPDAADEGGHGTHVAGVIAALRRDMAGVAGVAPHVRLMLLKVVDAYGAAYGSHVAAALEYAGSMGAHVVVTSVGPVAPPPSAAAGAAPQPQLLAANAAATQLYAAAVRSLRDRGVLVVAPAGDDGLNLDAVKAAGLEHLPCTLAAPPHSLGNVLCVGAVDPSDRRVRIAVPGLVPAMGSNYGAATVGITAPGADIFSTLPDRAAQVFDVVNGGGYGNMSGTSAAAPIVAGVAALVVGVIGGGAATSGLAAAPPRRAPPPPLASLPPSPPGLGRGAPLPAGGVGASASTSTTSRAGQGLAATGPFFQAELVRSLVLATADVAPAGGSGMTGDRRVNAARAVRAAYALLGNLHLLTPSPAYYSAGGSSSSGASVLFPGLIEEYFTVLGQRNGSSTDVAAAVIDSRPTQVSMRVGSDSEPLAALRSFRRSGPGVLLRLRGLLRLPAAGVFRLRLRLGPGTPSESVQLAVGGRRLAFGSANNSARVMAEAPGYYDLELLLLSPSPPGNASLAAVELQIAPDSTSGSSSTSSSSGGSGSAKAQYALLPDALLLSAGYAPPLPPTYSPNLDLRGARSAVAPGYHVMWSSRGASPGDDPSAAPAPLTPALLSRISSAAAVPPGAGAGYVPFEGSALVPDLFPVAGDLAALIASTADASGVAPPDWNTTGVYGVAVGHVQPPSNGQLRLQVTCTSCQVYLQGVLLLDASQVQPVAQGPTGPAAAANMAITRSTGCVAFPGAAASDPDSSTSGGSSSRSGSGDLGAVYGLEVRFEAGYVPRSVVSLQWSTCTPGAASGSRSSSGGGASTSGTPALTSDAGQWGSLAGLLASATMWAPAAAALPTLPRGLQCDVWQAGRNERPTAVPSPALLPPTASIRLPRRAAPGNATSSGSGSGSSRNSSSDTAALLAGLTALNSTGGACANITAANNCRLSSDLSIAALLAAYAASNANTSTTSGSLRPPSPPSPPSPPPADGPRYNVRCWTFWSARGFTGNRLAVRLPAAPSRVFLGSQRVYYNDPDEPPGANYNRLVQLPASSSLGPGYHQLLAYEFAGLAANAVFGLLDGVNQFVSNASLTVDRRMVLPPL